MLFRSDEITRAFGRTKFFVKSKTMRGERTEMAVEVFCVRIKNIFEKMINKKRYVFVGMCFLWMYFAGGWTSVF